jgi:hypothetical protein
MGGSTDMLAAEDEKRFFAMESATGRRPARAYTQT